MFLFVASHLGSGSSSLMEALSNHPYFCVCSYDIYKNGMDLLLMKDANPFGLIYVDQILYNHQFNCTNLWNQCKWIYFIREPQSSVSEMISKYGYSEKGAYDYYYNRLQRMKQMSKKTGGFLATYENMDFSKLQKWLGIAKPFSSFKRSEEKLTIDGNAENVKYQFYLKKIAENLNTA